MKQKAAAIIEKEFTRTRVINLNEEEEGRFDILQVNFYPGRPGLAYGYRAQDYVKYFTSNDMWHLICARKKRLYCITCSVLLFTNLKVVGNAKHKLC